MIRPEIDMLNSFTQFSYDIELIGHAETYRSGFNEGYHVLSATLVASLDATLGMPHIVHADSCYADGYENGRNGPFSQHRLAECGSDYEHGFMAGCLSVMSNDKEVCNIAEDA